MLAEVRGKRQCRFHLQGKCEKGDKCLYDHGTETETEGGDVTDARDGRDKRLRNDADALSEPKIEDDPVVESEASSEEFESRLLLGVSVKFGPGAQVVDVEFPTDCSTAQVNTVSCTWYKPSRIAWLHYNNISQAKKVEEFISSGGLRIARRKIQALLQKPDERFQDVKPTIISVQLRNLDICTPQSLIERRIPKRFTPMNVIMGKASYSMSIPEAEGYVKTLLDGVGPLEAWEPNSTMSATQVKAIARFQTAEDACKAVSQLNGHIMAQMANSKLFVRHVISVKFNVPRAMYSSIQEELNQLRSQIWDTGHVHIKAYPLTDPTQKFIALRVYGDDAKAVAKVKHAFEKIVAGDVAMNGDLAIWDDFFIGSEGLKFLNELSYTARGYIYRDTRKHRLSLYGSADCREKLRSTLIEKVDSLAKTTHEIPLSAEDLEKALHGGLRRIVSSLGKQKVSFDRRRHPQVITITGSARDFKTARDLLDQAVASDVDDLTLDENINRRPPPDCVVCWTEAEHAYRTPCDHFYCAGCFAAQCCSSAGEGDLPLRCLGDSGSCARVFALSEIKQALAALSTTTTTTEAAGFEKLLENSFVMHVRLNPKSFQYCPTPDCQQIYRVVSKHDNDGGGGVGGGTGVSITCPTCLTSICTKCQVTAHDGMTCEVYQRLVRDGEEEFREWKRENGNRVKDCPVCEVPIEKAYGCNHLWVVLFFFLLTSHSTSLVYFFFFFFF